jgi:ATP phosphoribosyltransferase
MIRLALPDGHQQKHVIGLFDQTSLTLSGYQLGAPEKRPGITLPGMTVTVVRPQDMPGQVAVGNFDLAVTGLDWLLDHLCRFPKSPVEALLSLGIGRVRVVAVVHEEIPAETMGDLKRLMAEGSIGRPFFRIASEYVNLADRFALHHHVVNYRVIPTYGATEALIPEDADLIIENTETGTTLAKNRLKIVGELFVSTGCLIGRRGILDRREDAVAAFVDGLTRLQGVAAYRNAGAEKVG